MDYDLAEFAVSHALKLGADYADARIENTTTNTTLNLSKAATPEAIPVFNAKK